MKYFPITSTVSTFLAFVLESTFCVNLIGLKLELTKKSLYSLTSCKLRIVIGGLRKNPLCVLPSSAVNVSEKFFCFFDSKSFTDFNSILPTIFLLTTPSMFVSGSGFTSYSVKLNTVSSFSQTSNVQWHRNALQFEHHLECIAYTTGGWYVVIQ